MVIQALNRQRDGRISVSSSEAFIVRLLPRNKCFKIKNKKLNTTVRPCTQHSVRKSNISYVQHPPLSVQHRVLCFLSQSPAPYPLHPIPCTLFFEANSHAHPLNSTPIGPSLPKTPCPLRPEPRCRAALLLLPPSELNQVLIPETFSGPTQTTPPVSLFFCLTGSAFLCSWSLSFH